MSDTILKFIKSDDAKVEDIIKKYPLQKGGSKMKKVRNPTRTEKKLMDRMRLEVSDWLVREHRKDRLKLVHRYTNKTIERGII